MTSVAEYRASPISVIELRRPVVPLTAVALLGVLIWRIPTDYAFGAYAFAGAALMFVLRGSHVGEIVGVVAGGPAIATIVRLAHSSTPGPWLSSIAIGFGGAAILAAALTTAMASGEARPPALLRLAAVLTMPAFVVVAGIFLEASAGWHPMTFDSLLAAVDRSFGGDVSSAAGTTVRRSAVLWWTCKIVYDSLPLALCLVAAARWRRFGSNDRERVFTATIVAGVAAQLLSQLVPACGPRFLWGPLFPLASGAARAPLALVRVATGDFRNAFPSLHMTGAFFVAWAAWPFGRPVRAIALLYLALTVMATLGSGEHYLVDLVVAAPFALAIRLGLRREAPFRVAVLVSIVAAWTILMRESAGALVAAPALTWSMAVVTMLAVAVPFSRAGAREPRGV